MRRKTNEPAGDAWIARQHTDTSRGAAHRYLERTLAPGQYTIPAHQPGAPRLRLLTFAVSVCCALGSEAQAFILQLSACRLGKARAHSFQLLVTYTNWS